MNIVSQTKRIVDLSNSEKATMLGLLSLEFLGVRSEVFSRDLEEKDAVALLRKGTYEGEIVGFSTFMLLDLDVQGRKIKAVFSGDTTVLPEYRVSGGIGVELGRYFLTALERFPEQEVYYVLISKGWRTYRVLPFFFRAFAPKYDTPTSLQEKAVMDSFGKKKYPKNYDPKTGLIMFSHETQRLLPESIDGVPPENPDVHTAYFLEKNRTYLSGTELVCVGRVHAKNFAAPLTRLLRNVQRGEGS